MSLLFSIPTFAQNATVLGVPDGVYAGSGTLLSQTWWVPDVEFKTERTLQNNTITARTKAFLFGNEVGGAAARLKIVTTSGGNFEMQDLDSPNGAGGFKKGGQGSCSSSGCTFSATVMNGRLQLKETWVRVGPNEFHILNGWQSLDGKVGEYTGRLVRAQ